MLGGTSSQEGSPGWTSVLGVWNQPPALMPPTTLTDCTPAPTPKGQNKFPDHQAKGRQVE